MRFLHNGCVCVCVWLIEGHIYFEKESERERISGLLTRRIIRNQLNTKVKQRYNCVSSRFVFEINTPTHNHQPKLSLNCPRMRAIQIGIMGPFQSKCTGKADLQSIQHT